jgi:formate dehydrogenase iron-sulfur subunit
MSRIFVPIDIAAIAAGANRVAEALAAEAAKRGLEIEIVRNGSRGAFFMEPLVEVETAFGRVGYREIRPSQVASLFDADFISGGDHPSCIGKTDEHPWFASQTRLTFARCGLVDPLSLDDYAAHGGWKGLQRAIRLGALDTLEEVSLSGLRGRGGAGFPTGVKWKTVAYSKADTKYVICNADEGDSGTFADRMIMEGDPFSLIEGMIIAGFAVGASRGYVYSRSEYRHANATFARAIEIARAAGHLGSDVEGSGFSFELELRVGAGAYVCGEETALMESLEGKRGIVRAKPPLPAVAGLFGKPTVINNLLSLATIPTILADGAAAYADFGMGRSRGTMPIQIAGNVKNGGLYETAFGLTLGDIVEGIGGGTASGRPIRAVQCGGPLGAYFPASLFDTPYDYEAFAAAGGLIGHGGITVFDDTVDMAEQARFAFEFGAAESCGKCTPCRIGTVRGRELVETILAGTATETTFETLTDLCETMKFGSLCALGGFIPYPVTSSLTHFPQDFRRAPTRAAAE